MDGVYLCLYTEHYFLFIYFLMNKRVIFDIVENIFAFLGET